jgi:putative SOS response-associated peptidase YedK
MCSHYQGIQGRERFERHFGIALPEDAGQTDVWPGLRALFIRSTVSGSGRTAGSVQALTGLFGLVPHWSTDLRMTRSTYNARSETVSEKPSFRTAWRKRQFCLILADNFYEPNYETGKAVRWRIQAQEPSPFGIAGIWDKWTDPATGEVVVSFSMLTVNADEHEVLRQFHKTGDEKRTPVLIPQELYFEWLGADIPTANQMLSWLNMPALQAAPQPKIA